ncbi:MAG: hypothetical protein ACRDJC_26465, partial [Thermomicrobiales bacterium]
MVSDHGPTTPKALTTTESHPSNDQLAATIAWRDVDGTGGTIVIRSDGRPRIELDPSGLRGDQSWLDTDAAPAFRCTVSVPAQSGDRALRADGIERAAAERYLD